LLGNPRTIGHAFHITSDEWLTWDQILRLVGRAAGAGDPQIVHVPSAFIARLDPDTGAGLIGDKSWNALFDNAKIKSFVPGWHAQIRSPRGFAGRRVVRRRSRAPGRRRGRRRPRRRDPARLAALDFSLSRLRERVGVRASRFRAPCARSPRLTRSTGMASFGVRARGGRFACNGVLFAALAVGCSDAALDDSGVVRNGDDQPRLLAPLSGSVSSSRQPVLTFTGAREARVDICYDRACASPLRSLAGAGGEAQPDTPLPAGTVFWRAVARGRISATWQLLIPSRESPPTAVAATVPDYNGDGVADAAVGQPGAATGVVAVFYGSLGRCQRRAVVVVTGGEQFGRAIAAVGDVNGDGFVDLADRVGRGSGHRQHLRRGRGGTHPGQRVAAAARHRRFGATMASAGDVDGDGYGDVIVGGREATQVFPGKRQGYGYQGGVHVAGRVRALGITFALGRRRRK
jgi:hypothetical protein